MDKSDLVSIIVPIYNVEDYLHDCVDSILSQSHKNIEVILVNDGSNDKSAYIIDSYKEKDDRVIAVHKENGGSSSARNAGLDIAKGQWISFIDSDDWIDKNMINELVGACKSNETKIAACGFTRHLPDGNSFEQILDIGEKVIPNKEALELVLKGSDNAFRRSACNKLYSNLFLKDFRFDPNGLEEDTLFSIIVINSCDTGVSYVPKPFYHNRYREGSKTRSYNYDRYVGAMKMWDNASNYLNNVSERSKRTAFQGRVVSASSLILVAIENDKKDDVSIIKKEIKPYVKYMFLPYGINKKRRALSLATLAFPNLAYRIWSR